MTCHAMVIASSNCTCIYIYIYASWATHETMVNPIPASTPPAMSEALLLGRCVCNNCDTYYLFSTTCNGEWIIST